MTSTSESFRPASFRAFGMAKTGPRTHFFWLVSGGGEGDEPGQGSHAQSSRPFGGHDYGSSGAIGSLRGVAGGDVALDVECGLELGESFERSIGAGAFVHFEGDFLALGLRSVGRGEAHRHGDHFVFEFAGGHARPGLSVAGRENSSLARG